MPSSSSVEKLSLSAILATAALVSMPAMLVSVMAGCGSYSLKGKHDLAWTRNQVKFSTSHGGFYARKWRSHIKMSQKRLCAGFVHDRQFNHYLKYGLFRLHIDVEVHMGGSPLMSGGRVTGWTGARVKKLRTKIRSVRPGQDAYVWCALLTQGAVWKVGAMRFTFTLVRQDPPTRVPLADGFVVVDP